MRGLPPPIVSSKRKVKDSIGIKRPARGLPLSSFHGIRAPFAVAFHWLVCHCGCGANVAVCAHTRACNEGGEGHENPASAVSGPCGPIDTSGYLSDYESNGREPLLMGIIIITIISMTYAMRCCHSHSDVVDSPWRCFSLHLAGQWCSELPAGKLDFRCAGLKVMWRCSRCDGLKVLGRIPWTTRTLKWQSQDSGREFPACRLAWTSPMKVWLNRKYVYKEHIDHHQGKLPSVHPW